MDTELGDKKANADKMLNYTFDAMKSGVNLIVFPELALTGYFCHQSFPELAEAIPGPSTIEITEAVKNSDTYVVVGMPEVKEPYVFNSAAMFGPGGVTAVWRKLVLATAWSSVCVFDEGMYFKAGNDIVTAETKFGKIGLEICRDIYYPEIDRAHSHRGAFLLLCISAVPNPQHYIVPSERFQTLGKARSLENCACLAYVNRVGVEENMTFGGGSFITNEQGEIQKIASQGDEAREEIVEHEIDITTILRAKNKSVFVRDARPDIMHRAADILNRY
jgi:predicted amidohydrolase